MSEYPTVRQRLVSAIMHCSVGNILTPSQVGVLINAMCEAVPELDETWTIPALRNRLEAIIERYEQPASENVRLVDICADMYDQARAALALLDTEDQS